MKIVKKLILAFLLASMLVGCEAKVDKSNYKYLNDLKSVNVDMSVYKGFTDTDHAYKKISFKESLRIFDEKATAVLYYGYSSCPYCIQIVPVLNEVAKSYDLTVYYVDMHGDDKISEADLTKFKEMLADHLEKDADGKPQFMVPQVFVVVNGEVVGEHLSAVDSYDASNGNMTSSQKKELTKIYQKIMKPVK